MGEIKFQKRLTTLGLLSLASIPFTGPFGLMGATAIFSGKLLRLSLNDEARKNYEVGRRELKKQAKEQKIIKEMANLMERENERRTYESNLNNGRKMVEEYLSDLPREYYSNINEIEIIEKDKTFFGFPTGNKSLEVKIK